MVEKDLQVLSHPAHPLTKERLCACYEALDFVGHLVQEDESSEGVEVVEAVP